MVTLTSGNGNICERQIRVLVFRIVNVILAVAGLFCLFALYTESKTKFEKGVFYVTPKIYGSVDKFNGEDAKLLDRRLTDGFYSFESQTFLELRSNTARTRAVAAFTDVNYTQMNFFNYASGGFFDTVRLADKQAVISESLAYKLYGDVDVVGAEIYTGYETYIVTGVVKQESISEDGYYAWLCVNKGAEFESDSIYIKLTNYDRINGYRRVEQLLGLMERDLEDYRITDMTAYSESIIMRLEIGLSLILVYIIFLLLYSSYRFYRAWKAGGGRKYAVFAAIFPIAAVVTAKFINFNYNMPILSGGRFEQIFRAITNYRLLPEYDYLSYNMSALKEVNGLANIAFIVYLVCAVNLIVLTKPDFIMRLFMKRLHALPVAALAAMLLLIPTSCVAEKADKDVADEEVVIMRGFATGSVTVSEYNYGLISNSIETFNQLNPDAEIIIDTPANLEEMSLQLMSGAGSDIYELGAVSFANGVRSFYFPYYQFGEMGLLQDLYPYMEKDPIFRMENYNQNLFNSLELDKQLFFFPLIYDFKMVVINKNAPPAILDKFNALETVSYEQLIELYEEFGSSEGMLFAENFRVTEAVHNEISGYIDYFNRTCNFDSEPFIEMLRSYMSVMEKGKIDIWQNIMPFDECEPDTDLGDAYLFRIVSSLPLQYLLDFETNSFTNPKPILDSGGKLSVNIGTFYSINKNSKNKSLAWKVLGTAYSRTNIERYSYFGYVPSIKELYRPALSTLMWRYEKTAKEKYGLRLKKSNAFSLIMERLDVMETYMSLKMNANNMQFYSETVTNEINKLLKGQTTPEMAAKIIQNKITLMLLE